ncbi:MAG: hypothetical protein GSR73_02455 [Desulfurococcales archaeon]|nr:hypothetical protein [Desulfurococcales archaeon]
MGPLCRECYVEVYGVGSLPGQVDFVYCKYCGRFKYQGGWNEPTGGFEDTITDYLAMVLTKKLRASEHLEEVWIEDIRFERPFNGPGIYTVLVRLAGQAGGVEVREDKAVLVKVNAAVCPYCARRITKRGYNAVLQIRSSSGKLNEDLRRRIDEFLQDELSPRLQDSIIGVEEYREGFDILIDDPSIARMIASKIRSNFMAKIIETFKLVGRNPDGTRKGRLTISVRIPDIKHGDVVLIDNRPYIFLTVSTGGNALLVDLNSGREVHMSVDSLWQKGFQQYPGGPMMKRYMLLSRGGPTTVFLDAESNYSKVIEVPSEVVRVYTGDFHEGGEYKVFLAGNRIYVVKRVDDG